MEHPYGQQYGQEGNPRAYMTMRDYRNLPYQWQQPLGRNPNPPRSMREYRDQWMSAPVYSVPSTYPPPPQYDYPEPPFYASTPQSPQSPQPSQPISPIEQAILDLTKLVGDAVVEQKEFNAQLSKKIHTEENSVDQSLDGLNDDFEHKWDNLQDSIEDLIDQQLCPLEEECQSGTRVEEQRVVTVQANQETETVESSLNKELDGFQSEIDQKLDIMQESISKLAQQLDHSEEESQEDECLTETILGEQVQLQPQEELKMESVEAPEELQDASVTFWPWKQEEQISALITEESSGHGTGEEPQEPILQPIPMKLNPSATAQDTKYPLPVAPSVGQVYILPSPASQPTPATKSKPTTPAAPKAKSNPLPAAPPDSVFILPMPAAQPKPQASTTKTTPSLLVLQNIRRLVASVHAFATTSKTMATAYIAWHSGWFGCGFGFGTPGPRHF